MISKCSERVKSGVQKKGHIGGDKCPDCGGNLFLLREKKQIEKQPLHQIAKKRPLEQFRGPEVAGVVIFFKWVSKVAAREPGVMLLGYDLEQEAATFWLQLQILNSSLSLHLGRDESTGAPESSGGMVFSIRSSGTWNSSYPWRDTVDAIHFAVLWSSSLE